MTFGRLGDGAQISNLLYRRFLIGRASELRTARRAPLFASPAGWKRCDTADWKSALRFCGAVFRLASREGKPSYSALQSSNSLSSREEISEDQAYADRRRQELRQKNL